MDQSLKPDNEGGKFSFSCCRRLLHRHARAIELHKVQLGFVVHPTWNHRHDQHTGRGRDSEHVDRHRVSQVLCRKPREIGQGSWDGISRVVRNEIVTWYYPPAMCRRIAAENVR